MGVVPKRFEETVKIIAKKLSSRQYAVRGTSSLVLQDIDMNVDDIDIVCDKDTALMANKIFSESVKNKVVYSETDRFRSYFGSFLINGVDVEIYGDWQIKKKNGEWSKVYNASDGQRITVEIDGTEVCVTSVDTELEMFADMGRWNAFHKIKRELEKQQQGNLFS